LESQADAPVLSAARSLAAMSRRFICITASKARFAQARSASPNSLTSWRGTKPRGLGATR
jgi:hypothetical protein